MDGSLKSNEYPKSKKTILPQFYSKHFIFVYGLVKPNSLKMYTGLIKHTVCFNRRSQNSRCKSLISLNYRNSKIAEYLTKLHVALFLEVLKINCIDQPCNSNIWLIDIVLSQLVIKDKGFFQHIENYILLLVPCLNFFTFLTRHVSKKWWWFCKNYFLYFKLFLSISLPDQIWRSNFRIFT